MCMYLKDGDAGVANVVERNGTLERILVAWTAFGIVEIPVDAALVGRRGRARIVVAVCCCCGAAPGAAVAVCMTRFGRRRRCRRRRTRLAEDGRAEQIDGVVADARIVQVGGYVGARGHAVALGAYEAVGELGLVVVGLERVVEQVAHERAIVVEEAAIAQHALPHLHANDAEYEEDEEAEEHHIGEHWQCVEYEHDEDAHACLNKTKRNNAFRSLLLSCSVLELVILGNLLMARRGLSTRMVRIADRLRFSLATKYSNILDLYSIRNINNYMLL